MCSQDLFPSTWTLLDNNTSNHLTKCLMQAFSLLNGVTKYHYLSNISNLFQKHLKSKNLPLCVF